MELAPLTKNISQQPLRLKMQKTNRFFKTTNMYKVLIRHIMGKTLGAKEACLFENTVIFLKNAIHVHM